MFPTGWGLYFGIVLVSFAFFSGVRAAGGKKAKQEAIGRKEGRREGRKEGSQYGGRAGRKEGMDRTFVHSCAGNTGRNGTFC